MPRLAPSKKTPLTKVQKYNGPIKRLSTSRRSMTSAGPFEILELFELMENRRQQNREREIDCMTSQTQGTGNPDNEEQRVSKVEAEQNCEPRDSDQYSGD